MNAKHLLTHIGVMAAGVGVAALAGVPFVTALPFSMIASCMLMMLSMRGHGSHGGPDSSQEISHEGATSTGGGQHHHTTAETR